MTRWQRAKRTWAKERATEKTERLAAERARRGKWFKRRRQDDPVFRLNVNMRGGIYQSLRGAKDRSWLALVPYTLADLRAHLEALFTDGMTWANYGKWHIDHVRPLAAFNIAGPDCPEFKAAWALTNLQPLWGPDNLRKGARLIQAMGQRNHLHERNE